MPKIVPCFEVEYLHTLYHKLHSLVELMQMQEAAARGRSTRASRWRTATRSQNNPHAALYALYRPRNLHLSSITSHLLSYGVQHSAAQCKGGSTRKVPLAPIQSQSLHPGYPPIHKSHHNATIPRCHSQHLALFQHLHQPLERAQTVEFDPGYRQPQPWLTRSRLSLNLGSR